MLIAPASTPAAVELATARLHLRVDGAAEDALIASLIGAATAMAEHELGRALVTQQWVLKLDAFPAGDIPLAMPPIQSVASIAYKDTDGAAQTFTQYTLASDPLAPVIQGEWPQGTDVVVTFTAGYGVIADVPLQIQQWILAHVGNMYANREATTEARVAVTPFIDRLLDRYRVWGSK